MEPEVAIQAISEVHLVLVDLNEILTDDEKIEVKTKLLTLIKEL